MLRQNGSHFPDNIFRHIFFSENVRISIKISLKFVPKGPNNNIAALFQNMAWDHPGDKPLSKPMMVSLPMHICVTRPQWINSKSRKFWWFSARQQYLQCVSNGDTAVMCQAINLYSMCDMFFFLITYYVLFRLWCQMNGMASQITGNLTDCATTCLKW